MAIIVCVHVCVCMCVYMCVCACVYVDMCQCGCVVRVCALFALNTLCKCVLTVCVHIFACGLCVLIHYEVCVCVCAYTYTCALSC